MTLEDRLRETIREVPNFPIEGVGFKDIMPILLDAHLSAAVLDELVARAKPLRPEAVAGVEARGFLFGFPLAMALGVPFIPVRKAGKLPPETISQRYTLEYGTSEVEMPSNAIASGTRVLIHDDLLATGGSASATAELIAQRGQVVGFSFLIELAFLPGYEKVSAYSKEISSLVVYEGE